MARPASMQGRHVTLTLTGSQDKLLRRALEGGRDCWAALAVQARTTSEKRDRRMDRIERERHAARSAEYSRRAEQVQALIDQLPQE